MPTAKCGLPAVPMDMTVTLRKCPASLPLTAEACQHTASIGSISLPHVLYSPPLPPTKPIGHCGPIDPCDSTLKIVACKPCLLNNKCSDDNK